MAAWLLGCGAAQAFVIAPVVEGLFACDPALRDIPPASYCAQAQGRAPVAVARLLDDLEPGGARGDVRVGYVLTIQLLRLYRAEGAGWVIDEARLQRVLDLIRTIDRPVVVYLAANHFDSQGPLADALARDPRNLMQLADGRPPTLDYFGYAVRPWTLRTDPAIPVNHYRFAALARIASGIAALPPPLRQRVLAVALGGELHHLFPDFSAGMGEHQHVRVTDYSPESVADFRRWLAARHGTVERFNAATGGRARSFDEVAAPGGDAVATPGLARTAHFGAFADGHLAVAGWIRDPESRVEGLELLVNGRFVAEVPRGFNRLDVYRTDAAVDDPSIGFRHEVDFTQWPPGVYRVQLVARSSQGRHLVAQSRVVVAGGDPSRLALAWESLKARMRFLMLRSMQPLPGVKVMLDLPRRNTRVLYNPLARDWNAFRAQQVSGFLHRLFAIARDAGLPADQLYSHQILVHGNSSWNPVLFATDGSVAAGVPWQQGINTYGGVAGGEWIRRFVQQHGLRDYAVPEFHPQQWKRPGAAREALELHRTLGARFVSPYYLSITSDRGRAPRHAVEALELGPNNAQEGSDMLYQAIRELAAQ